MPHTLSANEVVIQTLIDNLLPALRAAGIKRLHIFADADVNPSFSIEADDGVESHIWRKPFDEVLATLRAKQKDAALMETLY